MNKILAAAFAGFISITANAITIEQATDTLYARMSLPDSLDYSREFFV